MGGDCAVGCAVSVYVSACRGALVWAVLGRVVWRRSLSSSAAVAKISQTRLRIWWTSWSVVGRGYASFGLRPAEEFAEFLLLTGQSHVDVATKCSLLKRSCKKKCLQKQVKQIVKTCSTWAEVLQRLEKTFPVYETDLSVRTQIEELPMLPEFPSAARISEYVCDLEYLFSRMNVGSYGATEPHLLLMSKIPQRTWDDCRSTSERKSPTHSYDERWTS